MKTTNNLLEKPENHKSKKDSCLTPIANLQFASKDKIDDVKVKNLRALVDD